MRSVLLLAFSLLLCGLTSAADAAYTRGTKLDTLTVGAITYRDVEIRSINARTIILTHSGGMASVHLRDLSPEWQQRFNYDPTAEATTDATPFNSRTQPKPAARVASPAHSKRDAAPATAVATLLRQFGQPATVQPRADLRPKFFELELGVKNQGRRPSCAIFAVVSALEFQNAELTGRAEKFSEEYLTWATWRTARRVPSPHLADALADENADLGFTLREVVTALRGYGIPLQSSMPNTFGRAIDAIQNPPAAIVEEARRRQRVFVHEVPGRDNATRINNLLHAINAGVPVVIGLSWPHYRVLRNGYLSGQTPMPGSGHAVTLVGYLGAESGRAEDVVFIFKNSWGMSWGQGGYGTVTHHYLNQHLGDAVVLEVQPADTAG